MPHATQGRGKGRPRPQETIVRDALIENLLAENGPMTRNEIAEALSEDSHRVYLSLFRLREAGRVTRPDETGLRNHWQLA